MQFTRGLLSSCAASAVMIIVPATAQEASPPPSTSSTSSPAGDEAKPVQDAGIADIVITATRRETSLQKTPTAISVVGGEALQLQGRTGLDDLKVSVPNVNITSTTNTTQLYIRGIGNTFISAGGDPGVALYQDNAYISDQATSSTGFFDVERVEVLRGPQGAILGRNATGGAINVISARPTRNFSGQVSATVGDYGRLDSEGFVSGPLGFANTSARVSFQTRSLAGYIRNDYRSDPRAPDRLDDVNSQAVRVQTLTELPGGGTLTLLASHYRERENGAALAVVPTPGFVYPAQALDGAIPSARPRNVTVDEGSYDSKVTVFNGTLVQPVAGGTLTATANYRRTTQFFDNDCDGTPVNNCSFLREARGKDYYADLHYASADGPFRWLIGGTYLRYDPFVRNTVLWDAPSTYVGGSSSTTPVPLDTVAGGQVRVRSFAFYADARLRLTEVIAATGQVRYSETRKTGDEFLFIPAFAISVPSFSTRLKDTSVPFKVGLEAQVTPTVLAYVNYSTAFKDGALNPGALQTARVKEEQVRSIEGGIKSSFFDRRLQVNAAAFHSIYDDLQISQLIGTVIALVNAPKAEINGFELEVVAAPTSGLRMNASVGYLDPTLKQFANARVFPGSVGPQIDLSGRQLPYDAKWNFTLGATYEFHPTDGAIVSLGGNLTYESRIFFNEFNDVDNSQKPVGRLDLNVAVGPVGDQWKVFAYMRNVSDELVTTGTTIYSPLLGAEKAVSYAPPRHFGIGFRYTL